MVNIPKIFASMVFNEKTMKKTLPLNIYEELKDTIEKGKPLNLKIADSVAAAMKEWAISKGATHYAHWFQPLNGICAEKHDSFINREKHDRVIMNFSGKDLIKGEPDASSFPSGGLRSTAEARGYTAWDPTSFAFVRGTVLYIPSVFCSYGGEILDKKTPLLKSMELINKHALEVLRLLGDDETQRIIPTVGSEQEFFLVDKKLYNKRPDLILCKRTLFGAPPPKTQELEDHYFGDMGAKVSKFMNEVDIELWKLGIFAKAKHNEVAPGQYEITPIFSSANISADNNQLMMTVMKSVAEKHGLVCILHEKPFEGVNGSGKHNNWSLATDTGKNLFSPGKTENEHLRFLLFLCAVIKAVDEYQDLLKACVSSYPNDLRLGSFEAPPGVISIFLGEELEKNLEFFEKNKYFNFDSETTLDMNVSVLPTLKRDITDRNRTSPFAFTGDKFEFRMLGASCAIAIPNAILNIVVAHELEQFAGLLKKSKNLKKSSADIISDVVKKHKRILFNGDNYSKEWQQEIMNRGLYNFKSAPDALKSFKSEKNVNLFLHHKVYTENEINSRCDALIKKYCKTIFIEAKIMIDMAKKEIIPAILRYVEALSNILLNKEKLLVANLKDDIEKNLLSLFSDLSTKIYKDIEILSELVDKLDCDDLKIASEYCKEKILPQMQKLRDDADTAERNMPKKLWPYPSYSDLLFSF